MVDTIKLIGIQDEDFRIASELWAYIEPEMETMIGAFYERILSLPEFVTMVEETCARKGMEAGDLVAHINAVQFDHWRKTFTEGFTPGYYERLNKIGIAHQQCGLTPDNYVASGCIVVDAMHGIVAQKMAAESEQIDIAKIIRAIQVITRINFMDLCHAITCYEKANKEAEKARVDGIVNKFEGEVGNSISMIAELAGELNSSIEEVISTTESNNTLCRDTLVKGEVANDSLQSLQQTSDNITEFVNFIGDVAKKTNLLALNATIEAARAGDAGKGFAVVAGEVKSLAGETAESSEKIAKQTEEIQRVTTSCFSNVQTILKALENVNESAGGVSGAIKQQKLAISEISGNIQNIQSRMTSLIDDIRKANEGQRKAG